jgi:glyoxylase-like metal-dependent hydrolase (beta-lactamase superfamily II)
MTTATGITPLLIEMKAPAGYTMAAHAALLWDDQDVILVDTGIPGQLETIRQALEKAGFSFEKLTKIIITHQDMDHIGSLPELIAASGGRVQVLAHEALQPYLTGQLPFVKSGKKIAWSSVDVNLQDGDTLPFGGGIQVIFTPGHSPDHISLYHIASKTLISGDALTSENGVLLPPVPMYTPHYEQALKSVARLKEFDIETVITYHGGVCTERIKERLTEIADGLG